MADKNRPRRLTRTSVTDEDKMNNSRRLTRTSDPALPLDSAELLRSPHAYIPEDYYQTTSETGSQYNDAFRNNGISQDIGQARHQSAAEQGTSRRNDQDFYSPEPGPSCGRGRRGIRTRSISTQQLVAPLEDYDDFDDDMGHNLQAQDHTNYPMPDYDTPRCTTPTFANEPDADYDVDDIEQLRHNRLLELVEQPSSEETQTAQPSQELRRRLRRQGLDLSVLKEDSDQAATNNEDAGQINPCYVVGEEECTGTNSVRKRKAWCKESQLLGMGIGVTAKDKITAGRSRDENTERSQPTNSGSEHKSPPPTWKRIRKRYYDLSVDWEVWKGAFREIEGQFGSAVLAYFRFLKWLFWLNLLLAVVLLGLIMVPQEVLSPSTFKETIDDTSNATLDNKYLSESIENSIGYENFLQNTSNKHVGEQVLDFIQGTGWMERTVLFYGYYFNKPHWRGIDNPYDMPLAYLLTVVAYFACTLIAMVRYTAHGMKDRIVSEREKFYKFCNRVFCDWDYNLRDRGKINLTHKRLLREYTTDLKAQNRKNEIAQKSALQRLATIMIRICINLVVLVLLAASLSLVVFVSSETMNLAEQDTVASSSALRFVVEFLPSVTITGLSMIVPVIFRIMIKWEDYSPDNTLKINIFRCVFLRLASVFILILTLSINVSENTDTGLDISMENHDNSTNTTRPCTTICWCWETYVGQQFYKLVLVDFVVVCAVIFLVEFPRSMLVTAFGSDHKIIERIGKQEFQIPNNVLDLIYSQTICWMGAVFSPLIPAITVVKFMIYFYVKKLTLLKNCVPSREPYRASNTNSFFMGVSLISFLLCCIPVAYTISSVSPSTGCGPFRVHTSDNFVMWTSFTDALDRVPLWFKHTVNWFKTIYAIIIIALILGLLVFYEAALVSGYKRKIAHQKEQVAKVISDKQFLMENVVKAGVVQR